ncbi:glycosyltransferase family 2 protein [Pseudochryseolinea flava]|uniref:glycosyltransferase family 2 protein n=1 Tax=Pseudochryseolinea flava TaxID=2059302 RepID=UPI001403C3AA|nr:glycosyltransferase family A protein [Pseudochryseolinea flava]
MNNPFVSAICITEKRPHLLERAVTCFQAQYYQNKELIILFLSDDIATAAYVRTIEDPSIKIMSIPAPMTLGERRNLAIRVSQGEYFCAWDDDDWYHPSRISEQMNHIQRTNLPACTLSRIILMNVVLEKAYLSFHRPWEGSLICARRTFDEGFVYGNYNRGEDSILVQALLDQSLVAIHHNPVLYIYNYHGTNISGKDHWDNNIFQHGMPLGQEARDLALSMLKNEDVINLSNQLRPFVDALIG